MATDKEMLQKACRILEVEIEKNKRELDEDGDSFQDEDDDVFHRFHINNKKPTAIAIENLKHHLSLIQGSVKTLETLYSVPPKDQEIILNIARNWQALNSLQLQEVLVEEKLKQTKLRNDIEKKQQVINENRKLVDILKKEKQSLQSRHGDLENEKVKDLEEKLSNVKKMYSEMKVHLKETVEAYFPDPQIPGFSGMYSLLNDLTQRLQNRDRDTYVNVSNAMWPYYLEILEKHGIIERHPTDFKKIRMVDFSDGRLGS